MADDPLEAHGAKALIRSLHEQFPRDQAESLAVDNAITFYVAGHETTANALAWTAVGLVVLLDAILLDSDPRDMALWTGERPVSAVFQGGRVVRAHESWNSAA